MSSPIGHSLAGYLVSDFKSARDDKNRLWQIILFVLMANASDLDILPGLIIGKPNLYHHGISHSFGTGILVSLLTAATFRANTHSFIKVFILSFILYGSHLVLDYLSYDGRPPVGIPIFWPITSEYYISPLPLLPHVSHSSLDHATISQFVTGVFSYHNLKVIILEILVIAPILIVKKIVNSIRNRKPKILN